LSAMIFAVQRSTFSGDRFTITACDVITTTKCLRT
jgi:hypothetical protein